MLRRLVQVCKEKGPHLRWQALAKRHRLFAILSTFLLLLGLAMAMMPPVLTLREGQVEVIQWNRQHGKTRVLVGPSTGGWVPLSKISKHILNAVIVAEDARFYEHHGLDFREIWASFLTNLEEQRYARGGSTITQQVVKLVYLEPEKTIVRKGREAMGAMALEAMLPKEEILAWYLNLVDFGHGVYGIKKAAAHYFSTTPELLTVVQAVHLALVLPSPNRWSQGLRRGNLTKFGRKRFEQIVGHMTQAGYITSSQWQQALATGNFGSPVRGGVRGGEVKHEQIGDEGSE